MHRMTVIAMMLALIVAGCDWRHTRPPPIAGDDPDASVDLSVDAAIPCIADTIVCDDDLGRYVDCSATGTVEFEMQCPLGCAPAEEKCLDVDPSNGLAAYLDMASDGPDVVFTGESLLQDAVVFNNGVSIDVPSVVVQHGPPYGMRVYMFNSLHISGTLAHVRATNQTLPISFVVNGDVIIDGTLDVSALGAYGGPGGNSALEPEKCAGNGMGTFGTTPEAGGSGAGGSQAGARGGAAGNGEVAPAAGPGVGGAALEPLVGGCAGGGSAESQDAVSWGGGGGGGIQIVSRTRISLLGNGVIDASGGGGSTGTIATGTLGGGGGGAGGNVLLEAPQVVLDGVGVVISTKGGSGGAAGSGSAFSGSDGGIAAGPTPGGINPSAANGGAGGIGGNSAGGIAPTTGQAGTTAGADGGGGGGGAGRARFNTSSGFVNPINGAAIRATHISTSPTPLRTRMVPANPD